MITEFSVTNFLSYKNKVTFSMVGGNLGGLEKNYYVYDKLNIFKTAAIYGANASGKSNLFKILTSVILMIRNSARVNTNEPLPIVPFKFDKKCLSKPSEFEIKFISKGVRYLYGFSADSKKIYEEYLYYYPNGREALIFNRNRGKNEYPREDKKMLIDIDKKTPNNRFFLSSAANWNHEKCENAFYFFDQTINTFIDFSVLQDMAMNKYYKASLNDNDKLKKFALKCLEMADLNIVDYHPLEAEMPKEVYSMLPDFFKINLGPNPKGYGVHFNHKNSDISLDFNEESKGTQMLFIFIPFLYEAVENGAVLIVDELDKSLHPELVEMIVNLFNDENINKGHAQLIFNTHDTGLLKPSLLRKEQIWFTEKDKESGVSDLYSLSEFKIRSYENYEKNYRAGVYGGIPDINNSINLSYCISEKIDN